MFDVFSSLPGQKWFERPSAEMEQIEVCAESGQRISDVCPKAEKIWIARGGLRSEPCAFHQVVHVTSDKRFRVHASCEQLQNIVSESWFVLPPAQEHYFKSANISYRTLPPFKSGCEDPSAVAAMDIIYPREQSKIFIPKELDGSQGSTVFQVVHRDPNAVVYWHLDGTYLGFTSRSHRLPLAPSEGKHELTLVDEQGEIMARSFQIVSR